MYPIERYLLTLKSYARNRSRPEGSIAEGYIAEECLTFCSRYFDGLETRLHRPLRNDDLGNIHEGRSLGKGELKILEALSLRQAHRYVLFNFEEVKPFLKRHMDELRRKRRRSAAEYLLNKKLCLEFNEWLRDKSEQDEESMSQYVKDLARGPDNVVRKFKSYIINGLRFHIRGRDRKRRTQNSGVVVFAETSSYSSSRDANPSKDQLSYFGVLTDIIELNYFGSMRFVLFKCDWVDVTNGIKKDELGFTIVNFTHRSNTGELELDEPFVFSTQATQVFYVKDPMNLGWNVVVHIKSRDLLEMNGDGLLEDNDADLDFSPIENQGVIDAIIVADDVQWDRPGVMGTTIEVGFIESEGDELLEDE